MESGVCEVFKGDSRHFWRDSPEVTRLGFWRTLEEQSMDKNHKITDGHFENFETVSFSSMVAQLP